MKRAALLAVLLSSVFGASTAMAKPKKLDLRKLDLFVSTLEGKSTTLLPYAGKKGTLVNLWATWCGPCVHEMPELSKLYDKYKAQGWGIVGIDVDESPAEVREFLVKRGVSYPILVSTPHKTIGALGNLEALPTTIVLDPTGDVKTVLVGGLEVPEVEKLIGAMK